MARLLTKGTLVELTGRVSTRAWVNKDGEARAGLNFHTSQIKLHGGGNRAETIQAIAQSESNGFKAEGTEDDLPFFNLLLLLYLFTYKITYFLIFICF